MSRALKLHNKHSCSELAAMAERVKSDPASSEGASGINLYNRKTMKLLEDIQWAIYWHHNPRGNVRMNGAAPQTKYW